MHKSLESLDLNAPLYYGCFSTLVSVHLNTNCSAVGYKGYNNGSSIEGNGDKCRDTRLMFFMEETLLA